MMKHSVYDTDTHFIVDPVTKALNNVSTQKNRLIQGDHNSERITFELPRYIEGHDMAECNIAQVHYINEDAQTKEQSAGVYEMEDMQIAPDDDRTVISSWLVSRNATKYIGGLSFVLRFSCVGDDGTVQYVWNTAIYSGISIAGGIYIGAEGETEENIDILKRLENKLTPQLYAPSITVNDKSLNIENDERNSFFVSGYNLYVDGVFKIHSAESVIDLASLEIEEGRTVFIAVTAIGGAFGVAFKESEHSDAVEFTWMSVKIKSFTLGDRTGYNLSSDILVNEFEEGMTWGEWKSGKYNRHYYYAYNNRYGQDIPVCVSIETPNWGIFGANGKPVQDDDVILEGSGNYHLDDADNYTGEKVANRFTLENFRHASASNGNNTFNFDEGMTWAEWKASAYNSWSHASYGSVYRFSTHNNGYTDIDVACNPDTPIEGVCNADGTPVKDNEVIQAITYLYDDDLDFYVPPSGDEEDNGGTAPVVKKFTLANLGTSHTSAANGDNTFNFVEGMTWAEWKESAYNAVEGSGFSRFEAMNNSVGVIIDVACCPDTPTSGITYEDGTPVKDSEVIEATTYYYEYDLDYYGQENFVPTIIYHIDCGSGGSQQYECEEGKTLGDELKTGGNTLICPLCGEPMDGYCTPDTVISDGAWFNCSTY